MEIVSVSEELTNKSQDRFDLSEESKKQLKADNVVARFANEIEFTNSQAEELIIHQTFRNKGFVFNEQWADIIKIPSRVIQVNKSNVICECSIDSDSDIFECKSFPHELFSNISELKENAPVFIKISSKPGSSRIDVLDGRGIVDMSIFQLKDGWDDLKNSGLDQPFEL